MLQELYSTKDRAAQTKLVKEFYTSKAEFNDNVVKVRFVVLQSDCTPVSVLQLSSSTCIDFAVERLRVLSRPAQRQ